MISEFSVGAHAGRLSAALGIGAIGAGAFAGIVGDDKPTRTAGLLVATMGTGIVGHGLVRHASMLRPKQADELFSSWRFRSAHGDTSRAGEAYGFGQTLAGTLGLAAGGAVVAAATGL